MDEQNKATVDTHVASLKGFSLSWTHEVQFTINSKIKVCVIGAFQGLEKQPW